MEAVIKAQTDGQPENLDLGNWKSQGISEADRALLESFKALSSLSFATTGLTSLNNFPQNKSLVDVDLNENHISDGLEHLASIPSLLILSLENNQIRTFEDLVPLARLKGLLTIDLAGNPVAQDAQYPRRLFEMIPSLKSVDGKDLDGNEVLEIAPEVEYEAVEEEEEEKEEEEDEYSSEEEVDDEDDDDSLDDEFEGKKRTGGSKGDKPRKKRKISD